jgi:hypothetical protein
LFGLLFAAMAAGLATIQVEVNGRPLYLNEPPTLVSGRTMVPLRGIFESLGAQVDWDASRRTITATKDATNVQLAIGDYRATVNGQIIHLDAPAMILRGSTMVPLRFVSEALGADVKWFAATQTVSITTVQDSIAVSPIVSQPATVMLNGRTVPLDTSRPFVANGAILLPLAPVMNAANVPYAYNEHGPNVRVGTDNGELYLHIGSDYALLEGMRVPLETPAQLVNGQVYVPLRFLSLATGLTTNWDAPQQTVSMSSGQNPITEIPYVPQPATVTLNGRTVPLGTSRPVFADGAILVPLAPVMNAANVPYAYNENGQSVRVGTGNGELYLNIGSAYALLEGTRMPLETPAQLVNGQVYVPLRFLSLATGLTSSWNAPQQTVSMTNGQVPITEIPVVSQPAAQRVVVIPAGTVIPVTLDRILSSATNNRGDDVRVTVRSIQDGDAEFPLGTRLVGIVSDVQQKGAGQPGMLDLTFQEVQLPDGQKARLTGSLISLDDKAVTQSADGRLVANNKTSSDRLKFIAIGTGAGLIIGKLLDKNLIVGGLLGAAAGYIYSEFSKDKVQSTDVTVPAGTVFGVRLEQNLAYNASHAYVTARADYNRRALSKVP